MSNNFLFLIVLYQLQLEDSMTYQTLMNITNDCQNLNLMVYNNGPKDIKVPNENIHYLYDPANSGVYGAYQAAFKYACQNQIDWIVLLDQDTTLTAEYLAELTEAVAANEKNEVISAFVPKVKSEQLFISPIKIGNLSHLDNTVHSSGICEPEIMAISSGTCLRRTFLEGIGGFNHAFKLDYLDHWLFWKIYQEHKKAYVLPVTIEHSLSVLNYQIISLERYQSIAQSEFLFYRDYQTHFFQKYRRHLLPRFLKQLLTVKNKKIAGYTFKTFLQTFKKKH